MISAVFHKEFYTEKMVGDVGNDPTEYKYARFTVWTVSLTVYSPKMVEARRVELLSYY